MKNQNMQDERVVAQQRKINSEAYGILMLALLGSILIQQFFMDASFKQYAVEFICFFGMSIYMIIRYMMLGLSLHGEGKHAKTITLVNSLVVGIVVSAINGALNYAKYAQQYETDGIGYFIAVLFVTFISAAVPVYIILSSLSYLSEKKQAKIIKKLEDEEAR